MVLLKYFRGASCFYMAAVLFLFSTSCEKKANAPEEEEILLEEVLDTLAIYKPKEFEAMNFENPQSTWSNKRSRHSEHFVVYWGKDYGTADPNASSVPEAYRVDIDDLLTKAEEFYKLNVETLRFAERGVDKSNLDKYKMMIFLHYTTDWMAYGGGYDDVIGALWISPSTCKPVGSTIAHEIGHSFQYQVRCDLGANHGFRYGFGGNGGNAFWEQTAQWQAMQSYPAEIFETHHFPVYTENYHRHQFHELYRYANYFVHYYWADKYGLDMIGRLWREATSPEDPLQAYMRLTAINNRQLNDEIYDMAAKYATWDLDALRSRGKEYIGRHTYKFDVQADGGLRVSYDHCPGTTGYNVVALDVPAAGEAISIDFKGLINANGFNTISDPSRAGWRYGLVALLNSGERVYSPMYDNREGTISFAIPDQCQKLFFIVSGAPTSYALHAWDENEDNDEQWPYEIKVHGTNVTGYVTFENDDKPQDVTFNFDVDIPFDATAYGGKNISIDQTALAKAFVLQPSAISSAIGSTIKFYGVESSGSLNANTTANGLGHWFGANGNVIGWGSDARVYSEFNPASMMFLVGQYPNQTTVGDTFKVSQALVYEYESGKRVQATFVFNITIE
ncbi:DUF4859 domain-containing protein [Sphingobacterium alkalisoli]|uniref:DUF4859 domain-containing protein n=1 Tax=Sphingobacterium alkalisoli TaxID=1874115 RepID=A0A4U0H029_9SPHI|nr:DUF4859 domain-containing protein [Sphingobacterium alkalisoli]TJY63522.1 DUF4859 domain-containing protein [Sphingobacterium alkalisoli]GGH26609.1 hypothetical protein GCM10011418_35970 [Sphingobacterium alkalisoli]